MSLPGLMKHIDEHDYITREALSVVYSSKLMTGLRPFVRNIARFHINYLFLYGDIKKYKAFISFLKEDYPDIKPAFKPYQLIVGMVPDLLYRPVSAIKRKKTFG